nr:ribosomal protein S subunit 4 [Haplopteris ensiformis]UQV94711.1 ribosomal protein S subunit 4 [Haplopteris ensiformis]UQV94730.1 ribosomal protein S subunit 4 [Haplopteris ensiformis]
MLVSRFKICRQMKENIWHKKLNPRKRALIWEWGFSFIRRNRLLTKRKAWKKRKFGNLVNLIIKLASLRKRPFEKRKKAKSQDFSEKLHASRKLSLFYGLPMKGKIQKIKPLLKTIKEKHINFFPFLEKRLDVILVRISFCEHISQARQLINHKHIYVNSKVVNPPGFAVSCGDLIFIEEASRDIIKLNMAQCIRKKERIRRSIEQLKRRKRSFLRPLFYPFVRKDSSYYPFSNKSFRLPKPGKGLPFYHKRKKTFSFHFHCLDYYYPQYLEVEYEKLNVVVFSEPHHNSLKHPYRYKIEKHCLL